MDSTLRVIHGAFQEFKEGSRGSHRISGGFEESSRVLMGYFWRSQVLSRDIRNFSRFLGVIT